MFNGKLQKMPFESNKNNLNSNNGKRLTILR